MLEVGGVGLDEGGGVRVGVRSGSQLWSCRSLNSGVVVVIVVAAAIAGGGV